MTNLSQAIADLKAGSINLAECLANLPDLDKPKQLQLVLADQEYRKSQNLPCNANDYLPVFPWLANSPVYLIEIILGQLPSDGDNAGLESLQTELASQIEQIDEAYRAEFKRAFEDWNSKLLETDQLDQIQRDFEGCYTEVHAPKIEHWLLKYPKASRGRLLSRFVIVDVHQLKTDWAPYQERFPEYLADIDRARRQFDGEEVWSEVSSQDLRSVVSSNNNEVSTAIYKHIHHVGDLLDGRYRLDRKLGTGAFGTVFLAYDKAIERIVAVKTVNKDLNPAWDFNPEKQISEARLCAKLVHPNIVPVFDVGEDNDGDIFIVSQYIDCTTLRDELDNQKAFDHQQIATFVLSIAQALYAADCKGIIHRDIKPANILIERETQKVYVADFGLAVRDDDYLEKTLGAGSPAYKSPEQIRCEGHRINGRSDLFSLGIVMYEMLTGERPFPGSKFKVPEQIKYYYPPNPSSLKLGIPPEIDRICMKLLQKDPLDRYKNGQALAKDIQAWLASQEQRKAEKLSGPATIKPRGLQSFTETDADFFLELLPGLRDAQGIPECVSFWTDRIQSRDPDEAFCVGMIMGPSGSGKSSLVKAGIIPLLHNITAIHLDATPADTESRLLKALKNKLPGLREAATLTEAMNQIRRSEDPKVVVFIDQFEQWLSANQDDKYSLLTSALRQCDGKTLQVVLIVRDDFGSANRFMTRDLETSIDPQSNFATVLPFDTEHAKKVLIKFGQAYGKLPEDPQQMNSAQYGFIDRAIRELRATTQGNGVVPVMLSVFAEMTKSKPWEAQTLESMGGASGILSAFLDESFGEANPQNRIHQTAASGVLKALLPAVGVDLKGQAKSKQDLIESGDYKDKPKDFEAVLDILDRKLRLIKPTEDQQDRYQLTHDFMIAPLREWLSRKQRETLRGRAELVLVQRAEAWSTRKESKQLPTFIEWVKIRLLTNSRTWTLAQQLMMKRSDSQQLNRFAIAGSIGALVLGFGLWFRALGTVDRIKEIEFDKLPMALSEIKSRWDRILLRPRIQSKLDSSSDKEEQLKYRLAKYSVDPKNNENLEQLKEDLIHADHDQVSIFVNQLEPSKGELVDFLWQEAQKKNSDTLLQCASALAKYAPGDERNWQSILEALADRIVEEPSYRIGAWTVALRGVKEPLAKILEDRFKSKHYASKVYQQENVGSILLDYVMQADRLADLSLAGEPRQFTAFLGKYRRIPGGSLPPFVDELKSAVPEVDPAVEGSLEQRLEKVRRQARAAIAILNLSKDPKDRKLVYDFLKVEDDPENLAQFIHAIPGRMDPMVLVECYEELVSKPRSEDPAVRQQDYLRLYAIVLGLGDQPFSQIPSSVGNDLVKKLREQYGTHPSRAVHSALGWTLRQWGKHELVQEVDQTEVAIDPTSTREWYVVKASPSISPHNLECKYSSWTHGEIFLTMLIFQPDRENLSELSKKNLNAFGISDREITWGQFRPYNPANRFRNQSFETPLNNEFEPVFGVKHHEAIDYTNWLTVSSGLPITETSYWDVVNSDDANNRPIKKGKQGFRLPSETEWKFAARSGISTKYPFGADASLSVQYAWSRENSKAKSHQNVCQFRPNLGGLFDVNGNMQEWVQDPIREKEGNGFLKPQIFGGSFDYSVLHIDRGWEVSPTDSINDIGFRIVQSIHY
jgi:serine/threonine protein kinase